MTLRRIIITLLLCSLLSLVSGVVLRPAAVQVAPSTTATPSYFYDRKTAFILNYAIDPLHGGMYTAVNTDGSQLGLLSVPVWGAPANTVRGTDKNGIGQGVFRYLITEYQRARVTGVAGINAHVKGAPLADPAALLDRATACADFVIAHLEIPAAAQPGTIYPNRLFYWGYANQAGTSDYADDAAATGSAARSESTIAWSLAELALALRSAGRPSAQWQPYL